MSRRYYFPSTGAAAVSPTFGGGTASGWGMTTGADRIEAVTTKISSSMTDKASNGTGNNVGLSPLVRQYVSKPIGAQTITGTIKGQARAFESSTSNNQRARLIIYVVSNDGATVRGVLYEESDTQAGSNPASEFNSALRNAKFPWASDSPATLSSVTAQNDDRIVFEWGANKENFSATGRTVTINFGDNSGTDLPEDETTTATNNPWIEFSQTITDASSGTTYTKTGTITSDAVVSGSKNVTLGKTGSVISPCAASGGDASTHSRQNIVISDSVISGPDVSTHAETGAVISPCVASGADVSTHAETGAVISAMVASGPDVSTYTDTGSVISAAQPSGADVTTHVETGNVISAAVTSGVQQYVSGSSVQKTGTIISGEDVSLLGSGAVDTVVANGILVDFDPPSGIQNVKEIRFDASPQTYQTGMTVACPQGDSGSILTAPIDDPTDTIWDRNRANDDGFFTSVKNTAGDRYFSSTAKAWGISGTVEPTLAVLNAVGDIDDNEVQWSIQTGYRGAWAAGTAYAAGDRITANGDVWRCLFGGVSNTIGNQPLWPAESLGQSSTVDDGTAAGGGSGDFLWQRTGVYKGNWAASTDYGVDIVNNPSSQPQVILKHWVTITSNSTVLLGFHANRNGVFATTVAEPSWNGIASTATRNCYRDGNILWIAGGGTLFGSNPTLPGGPQIVITSMAPGTNGQIVKITCVDGKQVVLANYSGITNFWGIQGGTFTKNPTDVDGSANNRFNFGPTTILNRDSSLYVPISTSRFVRYSTVTHEWTEYVPSGLSVSGSKQLSSNRKNIVISASVLSGSDKPESLKAGTVISEAKASGDQVQTVGKTGKIISPAVASGADVSTHAETGAVISAAVASGGRIREKPDTGNIQSEGKLSGADVTTHSETGAVVSPAVASGADVASHDRTGSVISPAIASGADVSQHSETGAVISAAQPSGADATTHAETGAVISPAVASGADVSTHAETGAVISAASASGVGVKQQVGKDGTITSEAKTSAADQFTSTETGSVISPAVASGADVSSHAETGLIASEAKSSGADVSSHAETGTIISAAEASGSRANSKQGTGAITSEAKPSGADVSQHSESGSISSEAKPSGADSEERNKTGSIISSASISGFDSTFRTKTGIVIGRWVVSGSDQVTFTERGSVISVFELSGLGSSTGNKTGKITATLVLSGTTPQRGFIKPGAPVMLTGTSSEAQLVETDVDESEILDTDLEESDGLSASSFYPS